MKLKRRVMRCSARAHKQSVHVVLSIDERQRVASLLSLLIEIDRSAAPKKRVKKARKAIKRQGKTLPFLLSPLSLNDLSNPVFAYGKHYDRHDRFDVKPGHVPYH